MKEIDLRLRMSGGVIDRRGNRDLSGQLDARLRTGALVPVHPGVYCRRGEDADPTVRILAAAVWAGPDAVLTGWAAARLSFWPAAKLPEITLALPLTTRRGRPGIRFERRRIPPELIVFRGLIALTRPSLTAVDLSDTRDGAAAIDAALRTRAANLSQMWEALALTPNRRGNEMRRTLLHESRHEPWSEAERDAHRLLDGAGITGWITNAPVGDYYVDILFRRERVVLEIDGWATHGTRAAFEADRCRRNRIVLAGYTVLNFTARQVADEPQWVLDCVRQALGR